MRAAACRRCRCSAPPASCIGVALENARLTRENLRASLTNERQMMANEVHDSLAQGLTYMRMRMSLLRDAIKQGDELRALKYWGDVDDSLTNAHRRLRELITYFRSRMDPQGLQHALAEIARTSSTAPASRSSSTNARPRAAPSRGARGPGVPHRAGSAGQRLQACQRPARAPVARPTRATATRSWSRTTASAWPRIPTPAISDESGHYGIAIMRERARRLGGELTIEQLRRGGNAACELRFPRGARQTEGRP